MVRPSCVRLCVALAAMQAAAVPDGEACHPDYGDPEMLLQKSTLVEPDVTPPPPSPGEGEVNSDPEKSGSWAFPKTEWKASAATDLNGPPTAVPHADDFRPLLSDTEPVQVAKERAIEGICLLHKNAIRLKGIFQSLDTNADGTLDSSTEVPAPSADTNEDGTLDSSTEVLAPGDEQTQQVIQIDVQQWLNMSLPEPSFFCSAALADHLCDGVQGWRQLISQGVTPDPFLTLCGDEEVLEPRAPQAAPAPIVIDGDSEYSLEPGAEQSEPAPMVTAGDSEDSLEPRAEQPELGEEANASLLATDTRTTLTRRQRRVAAQSAWAAIMKGVNKLMIADYCYKDVWARGAAQRVCRSGWSAGGSGLDAGLCYQSCPSGRYRFGDHCWLSCPSNMNDVGAYCQREYWGSCCVDWPWPVGRQCSGCLQVQTMDKDPQHSPGCALTESRCTTCPSGHYAHGELCYRHAPANYRCNGAELTCHRVCTEPLSYDCGGACALDGASCASNVIETVVGVTEAIVSSVALVASFGTSAAATAMTAATKNAMGRAARRNARLVATRVTKTQFRRELRRVRQRLIREAILDAMRGRVEEQIASTMILYATDNSETLMDSYIERAEQNGNSPELIAIIDVDPTGIAAAIDSSADGTSGNVQAAAWLNVFGTVDPTGILGAVAGLIRHDHCESVLARMQQIEDAPISVPEMQETCADDMVVEGAQSWLTGSWTKISTTRGGRNIYQHASYYMYYWPAYGAWRIGPDYNSAAAWVASAGENAECPDMSPFWYKWTDAWRRDNAVIVREL